MTDFQKLNAILPVKAPMKTDEPLTLEYFYNNVLKLLVKPSIKMCENGITLDMDKVYKLDKRLEKILDQVALTLKENEYIAKFQSQQYKLTKAQYIKENEAKQRGINYYLKEYDPASMEHRSYLINFLDLTHNFQPKPQAMLPNGKRKWSVKDVKTLLNSYDLPILQSIINKEDIKHQPEVITSMQLLAMDKSSIYNIPYIEKIRSASPETLLPPFNPGSTKQVREFFDFLQIPPTEFSKKTGEPSWGRKVLEALKNTTTDPILENALDAMIQFSQGSIVKTNFVKGFIDYSINGNLTSNIKLFGTKTMRPTSGGKGYLNFLNMPSTGSIFAKPIKECIIARPGFVQLSSDYSALEDRVIGNLSEDTNKLAVFVEKVDGHSLGATYYFKTEVAAIIGPYTDHKEAARLFFNECETGNKTAKTIRQKGKPVTFGLSLTTTQYAM